ncbi:MAG: hypothetical protein SGILL_007421 [Bacillariaceae sp.]
MSTEVMTEAPFGSQDKTWRGLLEVSIAKSRKTRGSNYVQLATTATVSTVSSKEELPQPRCRTVVFRGFLSNVESDNDDLYNVCGTTQNNSDDTDSNLLLPCIMKMCTDGRSKKVEELAKNPISEVVWWFPKTSEQYRIRGNIILVGGGDNNTESNNITDIARKELWGNLSDPARDSFLDDSTIIPGEVFVESNKEQTTTKTTTGGGRDPETGKVIQPPPSNFLLMLLSPTNVDYLRLTGAQYRQVDTLDSTTKQWSSKRVNP